VSPVKGRLALVTVAMAGIGTLAACGSATQATSTRPSQQAVTSAPLATSLSTARDSWAILPMAAGPAFWQVFVRPASSQAWRLVTPSGVADNGGLVAAGTGGTLTVAIRPSQDLTFSPLATSANGGTAWSTGLLDAGIASAPSALAASGRQLLALLDNGAIMASSNAGGTWRTLAAAGALADSPAGRKCGTLGVTDVSFGISQGEVLAAGTCGTASSEVFAYSAGSWRPVSLPVPGRVVRMLPGVTLVASGSQLSAAWDTASGWSASAPLAAGSAGASGGFGAAGAWVLLPDHRAATIAGPGQPWRALGAVPEGTTVLALGPDGAVDALAVGGSQLDKLTVWRLAGSATAWSSVQTIDVPIQFGSSS
jgi:hypothetical protein